MNRVAMFGDSSDYRSNQLIRAYERIEEDRARFGREMTIATDEYLHLLAELISIHQRCTYVEKMLGDIAMNNFGKEQRFVVAESKRKDTA